MISNEERSRIYQSQQNDVWEFNQEPSGISWLRTASNKEVVGMSHRAFSTAEEAQANAKVVGFQNEFGVDRSATW